jgi:hypothetical protein
LQGDPVPIKTVTKVKVKQVTPRACLRSINDTRDIATQVAKFADVSSGYIDLIQEAGMAGVNQDVGAINGVADKLRGLNGRQGSINRKMKGIIARFQADSAVCESSAQ